MTQSSSRSYSSASHRVPTRRRRRRLPPPPARPTKPVDFSSVDPVSSTLPFEYVQAHTQTCIHTHAPTKARASRWEILPTAGKTRGADQSRARRAAKTRRRLPRERETDVGNRGPLKCSTAGTGRDPTRPLSFQFSICSRQAKESVRSS